MVYICKDKCRHEKKGMINLKPNIAYMYANYCATCSESNQSIWYLKRISECLCCGSKLRRKSKHSVGRQKVTSFIKEKE